MAIYQRNPTTVEVWQLGSGSPHPVWLTNAIASGTVALTDAGTINESAMVRTLSGPLDAAPHAFLVRSDLGEIYPIATAAFLASHTFVSES